MMKKSFTLVAFLIAVLAAHAQRLELGLAGGVSIYSGDLSPQEFGLYLRDLKPAGGVFLRYNTGNTLAFRLGLSLGQVRAEDGVSNERTDRMLNFRSRLTELAFTAEVNLFRIGNSRSLVVAPYLFGGGSVFKFNPETRFEGQWIALQPLGTEGQGLPGYEEKYELTQFGIPFGGGLKFIIRENVTLGFELGARKLFTDNLDDVTSATVNYLDVLEGNGVLAAQLSNPTLTTPEENPNYRRGGKYDDWYFMNFVTLSFRFGGGDGIQGNGKGMGCPNW